MAMSTATAQAHSQTGWSVRIHAAAVSTTRAADGIHSQRGSVRATAR
jgi:hypothetical protein